MKRTLLHLFILIIFAWQSLSAQTASNMSRLNMTIKKKAVAAESLRFAGMPAGLSYKPLSLQNPKALNSFYRSFLFSSADSENVNLSATEVLTKNSDKRVAAVETSLKSDEQLFVNEKITISNIYPNPASEYAELDYNISPGIRDARLIFYNVLGSQMNEYTLNRNEKKLRVNTSEMPTGLYFYQLALDGKKVATKKMLVRHQQ